MGGESPATPPVPLFFSGTDARLALQTELEFDRDHAIQEFDGATKLFVESSIDAGDLFPDVVKIGCESEDHFVVTGVANILSLVTFDDLGAQSRQFSMLLVGQPEQSAKGQGHYHHRDSHRSMLARDEAWTASREGVPEIADATTIPELQTAIEQVTSAMIKIG